MKEGVERLWEPEVGGDKETVFLRHSQAVAHMNTSLLKAYTRPIQAQIRHHTSTIKGGRHKVPS